MIIERTERWMTIIANAGVLIGLALLLVELRQSNTLALAEIEQTRSDALREWRQQWVTDDHIAPLIVLRNEAVSSPRFLTAQEQTVRFKAFMDSLSTEQRFRMTHFMLDTYWDFETIYGQYQRGLVSEEYWHERIVHHIANSAPYWKGMPPPGSSVGTLPFGRKAFNEEVERILSTVRAERDEALLRKRAEAKDA